MLFSTLRRHAPVVFILALAVLSTARELRRAGSVAPDDGPAIVARFASLKNQVPKDAQVCYSPAPHTGDELRLFQLAQYAWAPRPLALDNESCRWTVGPQFQVTAR
jgi:hypothetical protein